MTPATPRDLAAVRAEIEAITAELAAARRCPLPIPDALARIRAQIETARADFDGFCDVAAVRVATAAGTAPVLDELKNQAFGWLCHAHGNAFLTDLEQAAADRREQAGITETLSAADRAQKLDSLTRRRYALEIEEEAIVTETGAARRPGVTPAAVLGVPFEVAKVAGLIE